MGRGDESIKVQIESDIVLILDARRALRQMQEWSWTLARRRWRTADGEEFQGYIHRIESGLIVVHRWMVLLRRVFPFRIVGTQQENKDNEPTKRNSEFTE